MNTWVLLAYMGIMLFLGTLLGIIIENEHHKQQLAKFRRTSHVDIEVQMAKDGWNI
jgi:uncharacterized protein YneF (UPF0154 family)